MVMLNGLKEVSRSGYIRPESVAFKMVKCKLYRKMCGLYQKGGFETIRYVILKKLNGAEMR